MEGIFYHVVSGDHVLGRRRWIGLNNSKILVKSKGPVLMLQAQGQCMSMLERAAEEETQFYCQPRARLHAYCFVSTGICIRS